MSMPERCPRGPASPTVAALPKKSRDPTVRGRVGKPVTAL